MQLTKAANQVNASAKVQNDVFENKQVFKNNLYFHPSELT